jgi:large subunit ribosomal protein L17
MRHHNTNRKFGRETDQRRALLRSLAEGLLQHGKMTTTEARAKELRPFIEKLITTGRKDTISARRLLASRLGNSQRMKTLVGTVAPRYKDTPGGYTRITKLPRRSSDGSQMALIEFV